MAVDNEAAVKKVINLQKLGKSETDHGLEIKSNIRKTEYKIYLKDTKPDNNADNDKKEISELDEEPEDADDNDGKIWYLYNDIISEEWLCLDNYEKLPTTTVEFDNKASEKMEYPDKAENVNVNRTNYQSCGIRVEQDECRAPSKYQHVTKMDQPSRTRSIGNSIETKNSRSKTKDCRWPKYLEKAKAEDKWKTKATKTFDWYKKRAMLINRMKVEIAKGWIMLLEYVILVTTLMTHKKVLEFMRLT
ncbi:11182_t:CDS:2, partial [Dentiscutata erythropus]